MTLETYTNAEIAGHRQAGAEPAVKHTVQL